MAKLFFELVVGPLFLLLDSLVPKRRDLWGFAPHHIKSAQFIENARAVYEQVKGESRIEKVIFARDGDYDFEIDAPGNTTIVRLKSVRGLVYMLRCGVLFVTHSVSMDYSFRWGECGFSVLRIRMTRRAVINLWHGIALKKLYALANPQVRARLDRVAFRRAERKYYAGLIASSQVDSFAMAAMFYPIKYDNLMITGLPRNDFLLRAAAELPSHLRRQLSTLQGLKRGRRLITYAPTYRQSVAVADSKYYQFSDAEIGQLKTLLRKRNAIFGFRMHYFRNESRLFNMERYVDDELIFDLGHERVPEIAPVVRESDLVISDYSSVFVEALYVDKPVIGFTYDREHYDKKQDGILYDLDLVFPGPVVETFPDLLAALDRELASGEQVQTDRYRMSQRFFYQYRDTNNAKRVVDRVDEMLDAAYGSRGTPR